jgi:hypothetical protein
MESPQGISQQSNFARGGDWVERDDLPLSLITHKTWKSQGFRFDSEQSREGIEQGAVGKG